MQTYFSLVKVNYFAVVYKQIEKLVSFVNFSLFFVHLKNIRDINFWLPVDH